MVHAFSTQSRGTLTVSFKPRPNYCNISMQHIATLFGATCCEGLATMLQGFATCWVLLAQNNLKLVKFYMEHLWMLHDVVIVWPGSCNNVAPRHANWFDFQYPTCPNTLQQDGQTYATCCAQQCWICCAVMLRSFGWSLQMLGQQCWNMLCWYVAIVWLELQVWRLASCIVYHEVPFWGRTGGLKGLEYQKFGIYVIQCLLPVHSKEKRILNVLQVNK